MSASILYHEFGMRRHRHKRCFFDDEKIVFFCRRIIYLN